MKLNFGKFKGQSLESLKRTGDGVSYLEWGAANLRDEKMRKAFADTLASMSDLDHARIIANEDGIGVDEALTHIQSMRAEQEEDDRLEAEQTARQEEIIKRWAAESGQPVEKIRGIAHRYMMDWDEAPRRMFSSDKAYEMFRRYMSEIWK